MRQRRRLRPDRHVPRRSKNVATTSVRYSHVDAAFGGPAANVSLPRIDDNDSVVWSTEATDYF
jgi:hypothetical protein